MKTCPYCAEQDLQDAAVFCKHCRRNMPLPKRERHTVAIAVAIIAVVLLAGVVSITRELTRPNARIVTAESANRK